jgi:beta-lactamase superfamily II metal-dependent hydrolase
VHEIDFLPVGDGENSGDAIAIRFAHPEDGRWVHVIIDAGFQDDGEALVEHVQRYYETDHIDLAILTHPDGDHIGGMGEVMRGLSVDKLWLHDMEAWTGASDFGGALVVLGPDKNYYEELVQEQLEAAPKAAVTAKALVEAARGLWDRIVSGLGVEIPFDAKEVTPRNNSSMIVLFQLDGQNHLLTGDAGVPALERAWDAAETRDLSDVPHFVQIPHHGSRRNASSAWLNRLLGGTGQAEGARTAFVSVVKGSDKHPSGRVVNAYIRRGCTLVPTAGGSISHAEETPSRPNWGPARPIPPMEEEEEE